MQVIFCEDIHKVGVAGETKNVSDGFARNFLLPRGLAYPATPANVKKWESEKHLREIKILKHLESAKTLASQLEQVSLSIPARAGREGQLFGSITTAILAQALLEKGFSVDRKTITMPTPIKTLGSHKVSIRLHSQIEACLKVEVINS